MAAATDARAARRRSAVRVARRRAAAASSAASLRRPQSALSGSWSWLIGPQHPRGQLPFPGACSDVVVIASPCLSVLRDPEPPDSGWATPCPGRPRGADRGLAPAGFRKGAGTGCQPSGRVSRCSRSHSRTGRLPSRCASSTCWRTGCSPRSDHSTRSHSRNARRPGRASAQWFHWKSCSSPAVAVRGGTHNQRSSGDEGKGKRARFAAAAARGKTRDEPSGPGSQDHVLSEGLATRADGLRPRQVMAPARVRAEGQDAADHGSAAAAALGGGVWQSRPEDGTPQSRQMRTSVKAHFRPASGAFEDDVVPVGVNAGVR